jgi:hypothetical protein
MGCAGRQEVKKKVPVKHLQKHPDRSKKGQAGEGTDIQHTGIHPPPCTSTRQKAEFQTGKVG